MSGTGSATGHAGPHAGAGRGGGVAAAAVARVWRMPLAGHVALLVVVLAAIAPFLHLADTYTSDEGAYAIQARDVEDGHWEYRYGAERYDPDGRWFPLANASRSSEGWFAYVQHPAYPAVLAGVSRAGGRVVGVHLPALLGAIGLAVAAWLLAAEVEAAAWARRGAFWLAAAGPVAVHAYILWAHSLSAAVAGLTTVLAARLTREVRPLRIAGLMAGTVVGVLLRSEGLLLAVALAAGLATVGLRARPWAVRAGVPALCLGAAVAATVAEQRWIAAIIGEPAGFRGARDTTDADAATAAGGPVGWLRGRAEGTFHTLLRGAHDEPVQAMLVLGALMLVGYAAWAFRRRQSGWERDMAVGLWGAVALYCVRAAMDRTEAMTGLFAAWPVALLGLAALRRPLSQLSRLLIAVTGLFALAVLATQYRDGGGLEWGGRFLAPALAPLAVLACLGLHTLVASLRPAPPAARKAVVGALAALAVLPTMTGFVVLAHQRSVSGRIVDEAVGAGNRLVVTDIVALPRAAWRTHPGVDWMYVPADELGEALVRLRAGGVRGVTLFVPATTDPADLAAFPTVRDASGPVAREQGRRTIQLSVP